MPTHQLEVQSQYKAALRAGKTAEMTSAAKDADKESHAALNALRARAENSECFDCTAKKPGWAVLPHGIFVCIDCAQIHRRLGRHISQVKAINTGTYLWYPHEIAVMRAVGNGVAALAYSTAPPKLPADTDPAAKLVRAQAKYETQQWGPPEYEQVSMTSQAAAAQQCVSSPEAKVASSASVQQGREIAAAACSRLPLIDENVAPNRDLMSWDCEFDMCAEPTTVAFDHMKAISVTGSSLGLQPSLDQDDKNTSALSQFAGTPAAPAARSSDHRTKKAAIMAKFAGMLCGSPSRQTQGGKKSAIMANFASTPVGRPRQEAQSFFQEYGL